MFFWRKNKQCLQKFFTLKTNLFHISHLIKTIFTFQFLQNNNLTSIFTQSKTLHISCLHFNIIILLSFSLQKPFQWCPKMDTLLTPQKWTQHAISFLIKIEWTAQNRRCAALRQNPCFLSQCVLSSFFQPICTTCFGVYLWILKRFESIIIFETNTLMREHYYFCCYLRNNPQWSLLAPAKRIPH